MLRLAERLTYRCADVSIATNASYRKVAIERGGMDPDKVFIVRSGPSLERMRILPPVEALKYGRRYLVGYLGVMSQAEGIPYLLGAMKYIIEELGRTDIHCTLVGGGPEMNELRALAEREGVSDYVNFTGRVPDQQLLEVLNTADVCVNPDEVNEMNDKSTMNKIMEYMSLGKPIVQFDVTEGRFSAQDASLYAKPNDAIDFAQKIIELIESPERRAEMGRFGRARVENELAWRYEVPKLIAAYDAVFAGR
jgi:glycosyltransferase involved in cell wall biosynthesis